MKNRILCVLGISLLFTASCNKEKTDTHKTPSSSTSIFTPEKNEGLLSVFNRWVGGPIDGDLGRKWIANHAKFNKSYSYVLPAKAIQEILAQPGCVGISFYYAMEGNAMHILPYGVDEAGFTIKNPTVPTNKDNIKRATALQWLAAYTGVVKAHFWGTYSLTRLIEEEKSTFLRFTAAVKDDGKVELLISNAEDAMPKLFQDESSACPPDCSK